MRPSPTSSLGGGIATGQPLCLQLSEPRGLSGEHGGWTATPSCVREDPGPRQTPHGCGEERCSDATCRDPAGQGRNHLVHLQSVPGTALILRLLDERETAPVLMGPNKRLIISIPEKTGQARVGQAGRGQNRAGQRGVRGGWAMPVLGGGSWLAGAAAPAVSSLGRGSHCRGRGRRPTWGPWPPRGGGPWPPASGPWLGYPPSERTPQRV